MWWLSGRALDLRFTAVSLYTSDAADDLTRVGTTHEEYLVVFVTLQNLVVIGAEISTVCKF